VTAGPGRGNLKEPLSPARWEVLAVDGWCSVEDVTRWAFTRARVVMANEAHNGVARSIRTREVGLRMIEAAHQAGVRRLAMEALPAPETDTPSPVRAIPPHRGGYLAQPEMQQMITAALELGWSLWGYEALIEAGRDQAELLTMAFTNWREREQARNLCRLVAAAPREPLLVWCGNSHASKQAIGEWVPMGWHFSAESGTDAFVIDQTVSVDFGVGSPLCPPELLATLAVTLAAHGGTAGILRDQAPPPLNSVPGVDAVIVSADNLLTPGETGNLPPAGDDQP
jgi:hypothetical protein